MSDCTPGCFVNSNLQDLRFSFKYSKKPDSQPGKMSFGKASIRASTLKKLNLEKGGFAVLLFSRFQQNLRMAYST